MIFSVLHYLQGFLVLGLHGPCLERFINLCVRHGIYLWHIRKESDTRATACVSIRGFFRIREAARKTRTRVRILRKRGLPLFLHRHRKRGAFIAGVFLFALILTLLSSFIWAIEIDETEKIDKNLIRNTLKSCGLDVGVLKYTLKASEIKEDMLREIPELSWLWVEVRGTRAFVHVREKTPKPAMIPADRPANIVASRDGVIVSCTAARGTALVQEGDTVQKGALLISGTVETKHGGTLLVHAEGTARAKTWTSKSGTFPLSKKTETDTEEKKTRYSLYFGSFRLPLHSNKMPFETYRTESETTALRLWGDLYLPITVQKDTIYKTNVSYDKLLAEDAALFYGQTLLADIQIPEGGEIINTEYTHILNEDGTITVTCTVECIEEIGEIREILEETEDDREIF